MYKKRFYRANGSERKRKCRERQVAARLVFELNSAAAPSAHGFDQSNDTLPMPTIVEQHSPTAKVKCYCRECFHPLLSPNQTHCTNVCSMNGHRRPFRNVSEMVICDVKKELSTTVKQYMPLVLDYPKKSNHLLPCDILNGQVSSWLISNIRKARWIWESDEDTQCVRHAIEFDHYVE